MSEFNLENVSKPSLFFKFSDEKLEPIKMTYGLEMDIRRMLPDPATAMQLVLNDPFTQDYIIRRCLTPSKKMILKEEELIAMEELDAYDSDELNSILQWAMEHALYFFVKRTASMAEVGVRFKDVLPTQEKDQQPPSSNGSQDSALTTPSAGLSE